MLLESGSTKFHLLQLVNTLKFLNLQVYPHNKPTLVFHTQRLDFPETLQPPEIFLLHPWAISAYVHLLHPWGIIGYVHLLHSWAITGYVLQSLNFL